MRRFVFVASLIFLLFASNALALSVVTSGGSTYITGTVYKHKIYPGNEVPFAHVDVACGTGAASIIANHKGDFAVAFDKLDCTSGSTVSVQAWSPDGSLFGELITSCTKGAKCKDVVCHVTNASPVLTGESEIPEFSALTAALALAGAGIAFMFLRRK